MEEDEQAVASTATTTDRAKAGKRWLNMDDDSSFRGTPVVPGPPERSEDTNPVNSMDQIIFRVSMVLVDFIGVRVGGVRPSARRSAGECLDESVAEATRVRPGGARPVQAAAGGPAVHVAAGPRYWLAPSHRIIKKIQFT